MPHDRPENFTVNTPSDEWVAMELYRELPRDLFRGVPYIQTEATEHLWMSPRESDRSYQRRLNALTLERHYWAAVEFLGAQPFVEPLKWSDNTPAQVLEWAKDIDGTKRNLRAQATSTCAASAGMGLAYLLVLFDEKANRPFVHVLPAEDVLDPWEPGAPVRVRFQETVRDSEKPWIKHHIDEVWVLYDGEPTAGGDDRYARWEVFRREKDDEPESEWKTEPEPVDPKSGNRFKPLKKIPLIPVPTGIDSGMNDLPWICFPPLHDVAIMNRSHMNKRSDLDYGIHLSNVPQKAVSGASKDEARAAKKTSHDSMWWTQDPRGKYYYVEHSGEAFGFSLEDLESLDKKMSVFGYQPLTESAPPSVTATLTLTTDSRRITTAQAFAYVWQDAYETAIRMAARYKSLRDDFDLEFYTAFGPRDRDLDRAKIIQQDFLQGDLQPEDYFAEAQRLGVYTDAFDADVAARRVREARERTERALLTLPEPPEDELEEEPDEGDVEEPTETQVTVSAA